MSISIRSCTVDNYSLHDILSSVNQAALLCKSYIPNVIICTIGSYLPIHLDIILSAKINSKQTKKLLGLQHTNSCEYDSVFDRTYSLGFPKMKLQKYGNINIQPMKLHIHNENVITNIGFCVERIAELDVYGIVMYMNIMSDHTKIKVSESPILMLNANHMDLHEYKNIPIEIRNGKHNITCTKYNIAKDTIKWHISYQPDDTNNHIIATTYLDELFPLHNFRKIVQIAKSNDYEIKLQIQFHANT
eukprot:130799_1